MRDSFIKRLGELVADNPKIMLITADLGFGVFDDFQKQYPDNFMNVGVAEQNMTAVASGMALEGYICCTYSIGNFPSLRCLEQIRNDACYHNANVKVVSIGGGFSYGALGMSHHATEDISIMRSIPELTVFTPSTKLEAEWATKAMIETPGACYLRLDKSFGEESPEAEAFSKYKNRSFRQGKDCTVLVAGGILGEAQKAADILSSEGIELNIIACHCLKPIDHDSIINATKNSSAIVTLEENTIHAGFGSAVAEVFSDANCFPEKFLRIAIEGNKFTSIVGDQGYLREKAGLDAQSISHKIKKLIKE